jgi:hypothetical protein
MTDPSAPEPAVEPDDDPPRVPISFWAMLVAVGLYLGWRLVQGIGWVIDRISG